MANDHKKRKMTHEEALHDLEVRIAQQLEQMYKIMQDINNRLTATSRMQLEPKVLAEAATDHAANESYLELYNTELDIVLEAKMREQADIIAPPGLAELINETPDEEQ